MPVTQSVFLFLAAFMYLGRYRNHLAIWSISTFVPMFGDMGAAISGHGYPLLAPEHNPITHFFVDIYGWDRFITVAIVANICAVIWLGWLSLRPAVVISQPEPA